MLWGRNGASTRQRRELVLRRRLRVCTCATIRPAMPTALEAAVGDLPAPVARVLTEFVEGARSALGPTLQGDRALRQRRREPAARHVRRQRRGPADDHRLGAHRGAPAHAGAGARGNPPRGSLAPADRVGRRRRSLRREIRRHRAPAPDAARRRSVRRADLLARGHDRPAASGAAQPGARLRAAYAVDGGREERLAIRVAEAASPLRVSAAEILERGGGPALAPRDALAHVAEGWTWPDRAAVLAAISEARETRHLRRDGRGKHSRACSISPGTCVSGRRCSRDTPW